MYFSHLFVTNNSKLDYCMFYILQKLFHLIRVNQVHVAPTVNAENLMNKLCALVYLASAEHLRLVDQSVLQVLTALSIKHVPIKSVWTLVKEHVV